MAVKAPPITVTNAATLLSAGNKSKISTQAIVSCAVMVPSDGQTVWVGGPDVTATTGFPVYPGASMTFDLAAGDDALYAVVPSGTQKVYTLATGV